MLPISFQPAAPTDTPVLWEMLTYAATMDGDLSANIAAAQADPFLKKYVHGWGRPGDLGVLAVDECDEAVGAAWVRLLEHSYYARNYAVENMPELAVGVRPNLRGQGVGTVLINALVNAVRQRHPAIVLSARRSNPAVRLYERLGFLSVEEITNRVGTVSVVMELSLATNNG